MGNIVEDLHNEELHGKMNCIFEDGVERSIGEFGFDSMNEKGSENDIVKSYAEVGGKENFEQNKEDYNQRSAHKNDNVMHGHGVKGTNPNIMGRGRSEWQGVECDCRNPTLGLSVRMQLTLPKVGKWSPPGLPKIQSSI